MLKKLKYYFLILGLIIIQLKLVWVISVSSYNITPDLIIIGIVYLGLKNGKIEATLAGFFAGLIVDLLAGSFLGLQALSYAIAGFAAGFFLTENDKYLRRQHFLTVVAVSAFISNSIYFFVFFLSSTTSIGLIDVVAKFILPTVLYSVIASLPLIIFPNRKTNIKRY